MATGAYPCSNVSTGERNIDSRGGRGNLLAGVWQQPTVEVQNWYVKIFPSIGISLRVFQGWEFLRWMQVIPTRLPVVILLMPSGLVSLVHLEFVPLRDLERYFYRAGLLPDNYETKGV